MTRGPPTDRHAPGEGLRGGRPGRTASGDAVAHLLPAAVGAHPEGTYRAQMPALDDGDPIAHVDIHAAGAVAHEHRQEPPAVATVDGVAVARWQPKLLVLLSGSVEGLAAVTGALLQRG